MLKYIKLVGLVLCPYALVAQLTLLNPDSLRKEITYMTWLIEDVHPDPFGNISRNEFDKHVQKIEKLINRPMSRLEFSKLVIPLVARLGDGHTRLGFPVEERQRYIDDGGKFLPLQVEILNKRLLVVKNFSNQPDIGVNTELVSINGRPSKQIIQDFRRYSSGEQPAHRDWVSSVYFQVLYWMLYGPTENYHVVFRDEAGKTFKFKLNGILRSELIARYGKAPDPFSFQILSYNNVNVGYLNIPTFAIPLKSFLDSVFTKVIPDGNVKSLIIDIQENGGGDSRNVTDLASYLTSKPVNLTERTDYKVSNYMQGQDWFPKYYERVRHLENNGMIVFPPDSISPNPNSFKGKLYVLTSHKTYSGAVWLAALVKCHRLGTVIGEPTGGLTISPSDTYTISLTYSKLSLGISTKKFSLCCSDTMGQVVSPDVPLKYYISQDENIESKVRRILQLMEGWGG